jgi:hypothetical protein
MTAAWQVQRDEPHYRDITYPHCRIPDLPMATTEPSRLPASLVGAFITPIDDLPALGGSRLGEPHPWATDPWATTNGLIKRSYLAGERAALATRSPADPTRTPSVPIRTPLKYAHPVLATVVICAACHPQTFNNPLSLKSLPMPGTRRDGGTWRKDETGKLICVRQGTGQVPAVGKDRSKFTAPDARLAELGWYQSYVGDYDADRGVNRTRHRFMLKAPAALWPVAFREEWAMRWFIVVNHPHSQIGLADRDLLCSLLPLVNEYGHLSQRDWRDLAADLGRTSAKATLAHLERIAARTHAHGGPLLSVRAELVPGRGINKKPKTVVTIALAVIAAETLNADRDMQRVLDIADFVADPGSAKARTAADALDGTEEICSDLTGSGADRIAPTAATALGEAVELLDPVTVTSDDGAGELAAGGAKARAATAGSVLPAPFFELLRENRDMLDNRLIAARGTKTVEKAKLTTGQITKMRSAVRELLASFPEWAVEDAMRAALRAPTKSEDFSSNTAERWIPWVTKSCARAQESGPLCGESLDTLPVPVELDSPADEVVARPQGQRADPDAEKLLLDAGDAHASHDYEQARSCLEQLMGGEVFERVAATNFAGDRQLARRSILEAFKRGHDDYLNPTDYDPAGDFLPEWDWEADAEADWLDAGRRRDQRANA